MAAAQGAWAKRLIIQQNDVPVSPKPLPPQRNPTPKREKYVLRSQQPMTSRVDTCESCRGIDDQCQWCVHLAWG
jgi:hypothetical protein